MPVADTATTAAALAWWAWPILLFITTFALGIVAVLSGVFAVVHSGGRSKAALAIGGALGALTSVVAMFLGILLHAHA